jgi:hypothetical protein
VFYFDITATLDDHGELTITGSKFPANATVTIRATYGGTIYNTWAQSTADSSGNFTYQQPQFTTTCTPGVWKIDATDGEPDPEATFNYKWSNEVDITCPSKPASGSGSGGGSGSGSGSGQQSGSGSGSA